MQSWEDPIAEQGASCSTHRGSATLFILAFDMAGPFKDRKDLDHKKKYLLVAANGRC